MQVKMLQACCLGGIDYKKGTHEVPESMLKDAYFNKLLKLNKIVGVDAKAEAAGLESIHQRNQRLHEKLTQK